MLIDAVLEPVADGENETCTVQCSPAVRGDPPQLLVCEKSAALVPTLVIADTFNVPDPLLVMVNDNMLEDPTEVAGKVSEFVESETAGPAVAVPLSDTVCGEPAALSLILSVAVKEPEAVGVKMTWIVQLPPGAIDTPLPQVLV
jgi:hypothetical protein